MILGASYATPLLSVIALHWSVGLACALIVLGTLTAAKGMIRRKPAETALAS